MIKIKIAERFRMTRIFFDTEFTGLIQNTSLISIGCISDCGKTFYAELVDYNKDQIDDWLQINVLDNCLRPPVHYNGSQEHVRVTTDMKMLKRLLTEWLSQFDQVEMWSDCLAYDWVLFNSIFGSAFDIPKHVYYIPFDLCTLLKINGFDPDISRELLCGELLPKGNKHNALYDAEVIKICVQKALEDSGVA